jgi:nitroreductase/formate hydrogenlyase subunit 6/NADH:ubiquinone oxidoreductase subunit I
VSALVVDKEKCNSCGVCVEECPPAIIEITEADSFPGWVADAPERCIACGHCVAVCPLAAIAIDSMKPEDCLPLRKDALPTLEQAELFLRSRRSTRVYRDDLVPKEKLERLIDIARYAASGTNTQPLQWLVIQDPKEVNRLAGMVVDWMRGAIETMPQMAEAFRLDTIVTSWERGLDRVMRGAPHAIVCHAPADNPMAQMDAPIGLTYLELAAHALGLGACWAGFFQLGVMIHPPMQEALKLPEGHRSYGAMMIGYPKFKYARIPLKRTPPVIWR